VDILSDLNPQQREAVTVDPGPVLVLAGPGSGKTRVLTYRLAYLILKLGVRPGEILALTFTNRAAREMESRALSLLKLPDSARGPRLGTFHSTFARILRIEADRLPITRDFVIFDDADQLALVRQALKELNQDPKQVRPVRVQASISRAKNELIGPKDFSSDTHFTEITRRVYERYEQLLLDSNALDFDDLLLLPIQLFSEHDAVLQTYRDRYRHLLVDEFQDTNTAQYVLLRMLAGSKPDLFVVADPDQSIYRWRGADSRNVKRLQKDFPDLSTLLLEQNYRSTQTILDAAMAVIDRQPDRQRKQLFTERGAGDPILVHEAHDQDEEGQFVVEKISMLTLTGEAEPGDCAVMYRTNAQSRAIEEAFLRAGVPYRLVGAQRFYGRKEVKDLISYLRLIHNPADQVSLSRAISTPPRGIGDKTFAALLSAASQAGTTPVEILLTLGRGHEVSGIPSRASGPLSKFGALLQEWLELKEQLLLDNLIDRVLEDVDYQAYRERRGSLGECNGIARRGPGVQRTGVG